MNCNASRRRVKTQPTIEYNATPEDLRAPGNWTCRVTNLEDSTLKFTGKAEFPGRTSLKQHVIRLGSAMDPGFNQFLQGIVAKLGVKIHAWLPARPEFVVK